MQFNEIKFQDATTQSYLGSPSILRTPSGDILAVHDYFGPQTTEHERALTSVYRSSDNGETWTNVTHILGAFWSGLFEHQGAIYLLGISRHYGSVVIRRSEDNGNTWTKPRDAKSGLLFQGGPGGEAPNYHCAPVPILKKGGRIYRAVEDCDPRIWGPGFKAIVISADEDSDLLDASNWTMSNKLAYDPAWTPKEWGELEAPGWLEGNVVEAPEASPPTPLPAGEGSQARAQARLPAPQEVWNILRFNSTPVVDKAAIVKVHDDGARITFDPESGFIDFPGGMTKFTIRRDPHTGLYLTLSNNNTDPKHPTQRNVLSLHASEDLIHWRHVKTLLEDDLPHSWEDSVRYTGFQYVDWQFDGDDIVYMVRCAYDGAHNFHDANRMVFGRVEGMKRLVVDCW